MARLVNRVVWGVMLCVLPLASQAMMTESEATQAVEAMLAEGRSEQQVVATLLADGRDAEASAVLALRASTAGSHRRLGIAGVCAATSPEEAVQVAAALRALPGIAREDMEEISHIAETFDTGGCHSHVLREPPATFDTTRTPGGGGGVSTSS